MLKKTILLVSLFIFSFFIWKYLSKPTFEGPGSALKEALWEWQDADDSQEQFDAAKKINFYSTFRSRSMKKNKISYKLSEDEVYSLEEAIDFFVDITDQVEAFEKSLSLTDIFKITKENPNSIYRKTGWFQLASKRSGDCKKKDYDNLRKIYSAEELYKKGTKVGILIQLMEEPFFRSYLNELIKIINRDSSKSERYGDLASLFYPSVMKPNQYLLKLKKALNVANSDESNEKRIKIYRKELVDAGVKENKIDEYILRLARKSPKCLAYINFTFIKYAKEGLAIERAEKIIEFIKKEVLNGQPLPGSIYDLGEEVEQLYMDGHTSSFYIKKISENKIELLSEGEDYLKDTDDDISFGFVDRYTDSI